MWCDKRILITSRSGISIGCPIFTIVTIHCYQITIIFYQAGVEQQSVFTQRVTEWRSFTLSAIFDLIKEEKSIESHSPIPHSQVTAHFGLFVTAPLDVIYPPNTFSRLTKEPFLFNWKRWQCSRLEEQDRSFSYSRWSHAGNSPSLNEDIVHTGLFSGHQAYFKGSNTVSASA